MVNINIIYINYVEIELYLQDRRQKDEAIGRQTARL